MRVNPPKVVRVTTRFHRNDARRLTSSISLSRRIVRRTITAPLSSRPTKLQLLSLEGAGHPIIINVTLPEIFAMLGW